MNDEEKYDIVCYYYIFGFIDEVLVIIEDLCLLYLEESEFIVFLVELYIDLDKEDEVIEVFYDILENDDLYV